MAQDLPTGFTLQDVQTALPNVRFWLISPSSPSLQYAGEENGGVLRDQAARLMQQQPALLCYTSYAEFSNAREALTEQTVLDKSAGRPSWMQEEV